MKSTAGRLMTGDPVTVPPSASYKHIVRALTERCVSAVPVVDRNGRVLGIVSEGDLLQKERSPSSTIPPLFEGRRRREDRRKAAGAVASELMTTPVVSIGPAGSIRDAADLMAEHGVKRLLVVDDDGRLLGVISRVDLLKAFLRDDAEIRAEVEGQVLVRGLERDTDHVEVEVAEGVVRLRGRVPRRSVADRLVAGCATVEGVVEVDDGLDWERDDEVPEGIPPWAGWPRAV